ncbi:MAG: ORF6N domain-containing protein [Elusimicrobiota bacterium]
MSKAEIMVVNDEVLHTKILLIRGQRVMIDRDLAGLYGVKTKVLNQSVKRNIRRFPDDFMFQLTRDELKEVVTNCDHLKPLEYSYQMPYVFTQEGVAMLSSVLKSERAIQVNIGIMRAFVKFRELLPSYKTTARRLDDIEKKVMVHDDNFRAVFTLMRERLKDKHK